MTNPAIPAEAVEAAARGLARHKWPTAIGVWESFGQGMQDDFRDQARAALKAAAPYLRAQALEDAAANILTNDPLDYWSGHLPEGLGFQQAMSHWLGAHAKAARAAAERGGE